MIPILFSHNATSFTTHGIGDLMEILACESIVNSEGEYELELQYPAGGPLIQYLVINNIIVAKVNDHGSYQAFRIYGIDKEVKQIVTVHAQHLSYDLSCIPVIHYSSTTASGALRDLKNQAVGSEINPFSFYTDIPDSQKPLNQDQEFKLEEASTVRAVLLDGDDSIFGCWEGDLVFDNYSVKFLKPGSSDVDAGRDRGVLIEYGIDMMDMKQEESISEMITGVLPYWKGREEGDDADADDKIVYGSVQYASGTFQRQRVVPLNVTEYYPNNTSAPTTAQIEQTARDWMRANKVGEPVLNLTISYADLKKDVRLHDAVTVRFVKIGIDVKAKVISYRYDVLKERCIEVEVGNVKPSFLFSLEDASRLKRGLIPPKRIANNSITSDHIENYGISSGNLGTGSVGSRSIAESAVTEQKIGQWAVTTDKINGLAVTSAKIQNGAVGTVQLANSAVTHNKIGTGEIYEANLGNNAVTSVKIKDGSVINAKIYQGTDKEMKLDGQYFKELSIDSARIGNSAITSLKIKDGQVVEGKFGPKSIKYADVADYQMDQLKLGSMCITVDQLGQGGWVQRPDGTWDWRDDAIASKYNAQGELIEGSPAVAPDAIVQMHIGDKQVGEVKLVETAQNAIAAVWDIQNLVAGTIWSDEYGGKYASFEQVTAGNTNFNTLQCTNSFLFLGHPVSTDSQGNLHI